MKKSKKLKWVRFEYDDKDCNCYQEVLKIKTSNNTDDDCYLTRGEMKALAIFIVKIILNTENRKSVDLPKEMLIGKSVVEMLKL